MPSNSKLQIISWSLSKKCSANMRFIAMFCSVTAKLSTKCHGGPRRGSGAVPRRGVRGQSPTEIFEKNSRFSASESARNSKNEHSL